MSQKDIDAIFEYYKQCSSPYMYKIEGCSRSKAYAIKRAIDKQINVNDEYCTVKYDKETKTAWFDISN